MIKTASNSVIASLLNSAKPLSISVALFLARSEAALLARPTGALPESLPNVVDATSLLKMVRHQRYSDKPMASAAIESDRNLQNIDGAQDRLSGFVAEAVATAEKLGNVRWPDVLNSTWRLLANPTAEEAGQIARFAVILGLRSLYGVEYSAESTNDLRLAYEDLQQTLYLNRPSRKVSVGPYKDLLIDLLALDGWIARKFDPSQRSQFYQTFATSPFGIEKGSRGLQSVQHEVLGQLPDYSAILNLLFAQPTGVPGLDAVMGGLMPPISDVSGSIRKGLVTLISGPAGSGKTSLCLTMSYRMAELGAHVKYVGTEESPESVNAKRLAIVRPINRMISGANTDGEKSLSFDVIDGTALTTFEALAHELAALLPLQMPQADDRPDDESRVRLALPSVIVIDSLATLIESDIAENGSRGRYERRRHRLHEALNLLRNRGICLFLVCGNEEADRFGLHYLVDNILSLDLEKEEDDRHALRVLRIDKTRFQNSHRGRHVFHISSGHGCLVSPSLHAVLQNLEARPVIESTTERRMVLPIEYEPRDSQLSLLDAQTNITPTPLLQLRDRAQILIYGWGPAGKAGLAMRIALQPRVPCIPSDVWEEYTNASRHYLDKAKTFDEPWFNRARVLVVSFLLPAPYYQRTAASWFSKWRNQNEAEAHRRAVKQLTVCTFNPGYIDPETVVGRVTRALDSAEAEGQPYSAVLVDGVHNILVQFPLIEAEALLWPTLYRLLRSKGMNTVATFTFFRGDRAEKETFSWGEPVFERSGRSTGRMPLTEAARVFSNLLIASSDYTLFVEGPSESTKQVTRDTSRVTLATSIDGFGDTPRHLLWDHKQLAFRLDKSL